MGCTGTPETQEEREKEKHEEGKEKNRHRRRKEGKEKKRKTKQTCAEGAGRVPRGQGCCPRTGWDALMTPKKSQQNCIHSPAGRTQGVFAFFFSLSEFCC